MFVLALILLSSFAVTAIAIGGEVCIRDCRNANIVCKRTASSDKLTCRGKYG